MLLDADGVRFMPQVHPQAELAPRDVVAHAIVRRMAATGSDHVYLDARHMGADFVRGLLHLSGRQMREPYTEETFAALCAGILQGLAVRDVLTPDFYPPDVAGHVLLAIIPVFTRLPQETADVHDLVTQTQGAEANR